MTAGIWVAIAGLAVAWAAWVFHRAVHDGKPRLLLLTLALSVASGIARMNLTNVLSGSWVLNAVGFTCGLIAATMFAARHSR